MGRSLNKLSARRTATLKDPGRHADGGGLYASISKNGSSRRWVFLYRRNGKRHEMGLGSLDAVNLARARELAAKCRLDLAEGRDPLQLKRTSEEVAKTANAKAVTFGKVADELVASRSPGWRNDKHKAQWRMTLEVYAAPLREKPVGMITSDDIVDTLQPIWSTKTETASRLRGRIEAVLDAARVRGFTDPDKANPARWRGHLEHILPKPQKLKRGHHAALPWQELPKFMVDLRHRSGAAPLALEWCILTAARIGEVLGMRWAEIDLNNQIWECPADRMKGRKSHRVPLSSSAIELLRRLEMGTGSDLVFPGAKAGRPLSNMVMKALYLRMGHPDITTHGFRSTFRDWAGETTNQQRISNPCVLLQPFARTRRNNRYPSAVSQVPLDVARPPHDDRGSI